MPVSREQYKYLLLSMLIRGRRSLNRTGTIFYLTFIGLNSDRQERGGSATVKERKLNYRFHNPNPTAITADYILKIFLEVDLKKVQFAIQTAADVADSISEKDNEGHSA